VRVSFFFCGKGMGSTPWLVLIAAMVLTGCGSGVESEFLLGGRAVEMDEDDSLEDMTEVSRNHFQPLSGYGSSEGYLPGNFGWDAGCLCKRVRYTTFTAGCKETGSYAWGFVPDQLVDGDRAPVYIYLHGFLASDPRYYRDHIEHLVRQGFIVVFPIYHPARFGVINSMGVFDEADQQEWLNTAILESKKLIDTQIKRRADKSQVYLFGYSVGGGLATRFIRTLAELGIADLTVRGVVLAHPQIDPKQGMPDFVAGMVKIKIVDWADGVQAIEAPTLILGGDKDGFARMQQVSELFLGLPASTPKAAWKILSDEDGTGDEHVHSDHGSPMCRPGPWLNNTMLEMLGIGKATLNVHDFRIYFAATDAIRDGVLELPWDLGMNSKGHPYNLPVQCDGACQ